MGREKVMSRETPPNLAEGRRSFGRGYLFGVPVGDLGLFASLLIGLASGFLAFFLATFLSIITLLFLNTAGHANLDYALTYKRIGLPIGLIVGVLALSYLGLLWGRRQLRRA